MKAIEFYKNALALFGQRNNEEYLITDEKPDTLIFINTALTDLSLNTVSDLLQDITISAQLSSALTAGIAYYVSLYNQDSQKCEYLAALYKEKRAKALSENQIRKDIFKNNERCN